VSHLVTSDEGTLHWRGAMSAGGGEGGVFKTEPCCWFLGNV
jgi:hypothetical protein